MKHDDFYHEVVSFLSYTCGVACMSELPDKFIDYPDFTVVLGGDGTVLAAGRQGAPNPLLVVNTGHLGFLTSTGKPDYQEAIKRFLQGSYTLTKRRTLRVQILPFKPAVNKYVEYNAVNEVVISKNQLAKLVGVGVYVMERDDPTYQELVSEYRADGLIVSTPTGSTAYNLSAGGPIIHPSCENIVITPICPQGLTHRPIVLSGDLRIRIKPLSDDLYVSVDGQEGCSMYGNVDVFYNSHRMEIVNPTHSYFQILQQKLGWGIKPV